MTHIRLQCSRTRQHIPKPLEVMTVSSGMPESKMAQLTTVAAGNCPQCWHLTKIHGPDRCGGRSYPAHSLTGEPCGCTLTEIALAGLAAEADLHTVGPVKPKPERLPHNCPGPFCKQQVPYELFACRRHWYQVQQEVRSVILRAWKAGDLETHAHAAHIAVRQMRP